MAQKPAFKKKKDSTRCNTSTI